VDSYSNDGTLEYLKDLADKGIIKLIGKKCKRGEGRQTALLNSSGHYIMEKIDMDNVYNPILKNLLETYITKEKEIGEFGLACNAVLVSTRSLLLKIGGWHSLQHTEHPEIYKRLLDIDKLYVSRINDISKHLGRKKTYFERKFQLPYQEYRDMLRVGISLRAIAKELWVTKAHIIPYRIFILSLSWITHFFYEGWNTFRGVSWEEYFRDKIYAEHLPNFETRHPDKIIEIVENNR